jgi:hypothetical protein
MPGLEPGIHHLRLMDCRVIRAFTPVFAGLCGRRKESPRVLFRHCDPERSEGKQSRIRARGLDCFGGCAASQ